MAFNPVPVLPVLIVGCAPEATPRLTSRRRTQTQPQSTEIALLLGEPLLAKVSRAGAARLAGVDGGVSEGILGDVLAAGASYVVIGRRLFPVTAPSSKEEPQ